MNQVVTKAIVLGRTDYGEADRILTLLTPEGKLHLLAKGVRRVKSKLAGGIELYSISTITFVRGRGEIGTLVSTRLDKYFSHIVEDLERTMLGYELIKQLNKMTEDVLEPEYFMLLEQAFAALDNNDIKLSTVRFWFGAQLLKLAGYTPNLEFDTQGAPLKPNLSYAFDFDAMAFALAPHGSFRADHIKYLRLAFGRHAPLVLARVRGGDKLVGQCLLVVTTMLQTFLHV